MLKSYNKIIDYNHYTKRRKSIFFWVNDHWGLCPTLMSIIPRSLERQITQKPQVSHEKHDQLKAIALATIKLMAHNYEKLRCVSLENVITDNKVVFPVPGTPCVSAFRSCITVIPHYNSTMYFV